MVLLVPWALESVLSDIHRSIEARLYYPALLVALTIPEICVGLTLHKSVMIGKAHYVAFIDKYANSLDPSRPILGLSGIECYRLRGGVVHRANLAGHPKFDFTHVVFTIPETQFGRHNLALVAGEKRAMALDLVMFCKAMIWTARRWYQDHENDTLVAANLENLIRYCPDGLPPFLDGAPVVASGL